MKKQRKTFDQYAFGTGLSSVGKTPTVGGIVGDVSSDFLMQTAINGLGSILSGGQPTADPIEAMIHDQTGMGMFANGGMVGNKTVEVEGDEVAETPTGQLMQFSGPSHENGGIQTTLPVGTTIFSDRLSVDGKTMQQRKKSREAKLNKLSKKGDTILDRNTLKRTKQYFDMEEKGDLMIQEAANNANTQKFAFGTPSSGVPLMSAKNADPLQQLLDSFTSTPNPGILEPVLGALPPTPATPQLPSLAKVATGTTVPTTVNTDMPFSSGDITGMIGNALGGIAPLATTIANRAGDTPNVNKFKDFGNDALQANANAKGQLGAIKDNALEKIQLKENSARARNRNSASSVNTLRGLDFATDAISDAAEGDVLSNFSAQMMQLFGQQAGLENQQDQVVMGGEQQADLADRQDRDAYFTNLSDSFGSLSTATQKAGKDLNTHEQNNDILALLPDMSKYGLGYVYDENGKPTLTKVK